MKLVSISMKFVPQDCWVGFYWTWTIPGLLHIYVCVVPMLPIRLGIMTRKSRLNFSFQKSNTEWRRSKW